MYIHVACMVNHFLYWHFNFNMWTIYSSNSAFKIRQKRSSLILSCSVLKVGSLTLMLFFANLCKQFNTSWNLVWTVQRDRVNLSSACAKAWGPPTIHKNIANDSIDETWIVDVSPRSIHAPHDPLKSSFWCYPIFSLFKYFSVYWDPIWPIIAAC